MSQSVDVRRLAAAVRQKRGARGLRATAADIGDVSAATLSRVEQGRVPDLDTFIALCRWLNISSEEFLPGDGDSPNRLEAEHVDTPAIIAAHLRADRTLSPKTAEALSVLIRLAYDSAAKGELPKRKQG